MAADPRPLVLHVVHRFAVGGLENGLVNLINRLPEGAWRHGVVALTEIDPTFAQRVRRPDVEFVGLAKGPGHAFKLYPRLASLFRAKRPAIVHTRNLAALEVAVPAWVTGVPGRIHGEHGRNVEDLDGSSRRYQLVRRAYSPFVTQYVALSRDLESYLTRRVGIRAERVAQIYNGVDTDRFKARAEKRIPLEGSPFNDPALWIVGTVGRLEAVKDQTNLARAFVHAVRHFPAARQRLRLVIVGDGALRPDVERILDEGKVRDLAWLPGERADVPELMRGMDCFVLPSLAEGISNTILEAMASGLPVIATRVGGNAELMEPDLTGRLVPALDSAVLAREVLGYFAEPALARRHGRAGRNLVERKFSLDRMVEQYHELYARAVAGERPRLAPRAAAGKG
ncbi:MAG: TIGR03088 family PEP-CTERM/XrtA system glycosyltransferase [Burkholderiales bacterium]|jgi:sugar transferase (PEP-CTERM/EpsH1 system associated)|nr:TIGR03088 family PEP-CTERM/XrtA system glycosyltransferase [Burkholderiales bacterium]